MIAVLASGDGSNFEALAQHFPTEICALICNVEGSRVLERAKKLNIPSFLIPHKNFKTRAEHEKEIIHTLKQFTTLKLVVLAGYMRVLTPYFFENFSYLDSAVKPRNDIPIINLHPAHLDEFKGADAYEYAVNHKYSRWGLSVHKVTEKLDSGALLNSVEFQIYPYEIVSDVKKRVKSLEHELLVDTVKNFINKEIQMRTNDINEIYDPKDDYIFKRIFGHKENIFINFVNSIFKDKNEKIVKSITFVNTEITKDIIYGKQARLDVRATLDDGSHINIEVQVEEGDDFRKRSLLYWTNLYSEQIKVGGFYSDLKRCVCINVINFNLFQKKDKFHTVIGGLDIDTHEWVLPEFEIHYLEVPKLKKKGYDKTSLSEMSLLEKWMLFLQAPEIEVLEELAMQEPMIAEAKETLYYLSHNENERAIYAARRKYQLDYNSDVHAAELKGERNVAKNLKSLGIPTETIIKATNLSKEEIESL